MASRDDLQHELQAHFGDAYRLERELGGGGMSRVFLATETRLGRRVVIKVLSSELSATLSTERFAREIQLAASLQQANIVPVLAAGTAGDVPWFTMPFVEGQSLRARLAGGALPEREALSVLRDVTRALVYAHERGIVHRDIKPDNVLLSGESAVVTDFGIAKAITASRTGEFSVMGTMITQVGASIGTPSYMAPEQAAGDPGTDHRADLYALGCLAYELFTGAPPFAGRSVHELMRAHLAETAPSLRSRQPAISPALDALVARLLAKSPDERPATARDVLQALDGIAMGSVSGAVPAMPVRRTRPLWQVLGAWAGATVAAYVLARAAVVGIGVPSWTVPLALGVALLGLPAVLFTWYVQHTASRALLATPTRTPGGTPTYGTLATMALKASPHVSYRRTWRLGLAAGGLVVLVVAAVLVLRQFGLGPAASLLAAGRVQADSRIVVAEFASTVGDAGLGKVIAQAVRTAMAQSSAVTVVSDADVADALRRMTLPTTARLDDRTARDVASRVGAPLLLTGSVTGVGAGFLVSATLVSVDSGVTLASAQQGAGGADDLLGAVDKVVREMRSRLGESLRAVARTPALEQVTTASLPALKLYGAAVQAGDIEGDFAKALHFTDSAIALDSTFAAAWRKRSAYVNNLGRPRSERFMSASMAYRNRERLTGAEREEVEAYYTQDIATRRGEALYAQAGGRLSSNNRAVLLNQMGRFATAESLVLAENARLARAGRRSIVQLYINLSAAQVAQKRVAEAQRTVAEMQRLFPGTYYAEWAASWMPTLTGGLDSLPAAAARLQRSRLLLSRTRGAEMAATALGVQGRLREFAQALTTAQRLQDSASNSGNPVTTRLDVLVPQAVHMGQERAAVAVLDSITRSTRLSAAHPIDSRELALAMAYAQLGQPKAAQALLDGWLRRASPEERLAAWGSWQGTVGEIALAEGRARDAVTAFRAAAESDSGNLEGAFTGRTPLRLARAFDRLGEADSARAWFERYVNLSAPGSRVTYPLGLPIALRRLGELAEARGDVAQAIDRYRTLVKLWANADAELQPQVAEMRQRITRLEAIEARKR